MSKRLFQTENGDLVTYAEYLGTEMWRQKRLAAFYLAGMKCQMCGRALRTHKGWHAHHNTYANLGCEKPNDLTVLCIPCHNSYHKSIKKRKNISRASKKSRRFKNPVMLSATEARKHGGNAMWMFDQAKKYGYC